jgi:OOP family OmpA-OmpF porin
MNAPYTLAAGLLVGASAWAAVVPAQAQGQGLRIRPGALALASTAAAAGPGMGTAVAQAADTPPATLAQAADTPPAGGAAAAPAGVDSGFNSAPPTDRRSYAPGSVTAQAGTGTTTTTTTGSFDDSRYSLLPGTRGGYVGLNIGRPEYDSSCGTIAGLSCDDPDTSWRIYTGGMFNPFFGVELGYVDMGEADRAGGQVQSRGVDLSLVGRLPLAQSFSVFGKVGATYGRTEVSALAGSGVVTGTETGFAPSIGAGLSFDLGQQWSVLLEWDRHDFRFPGGEREEVTSNSLGVKYLF